MGGVIDDTKELLNAADVLAGPPQWPKEPKPWGKLVGDNDVVFEDGKVVVFHDPVDEAHESARAPGETRLTLLSKKHVHSLLDLGVHDDGLAAAVLNGIQQAAYRLGLEKTGFEVRAHVYPPLQHRPELAFQIRAGKPPKAKPTA